MLNFFERNPIFSPKQSFFPTFNWSQQTSLEAKKTPLNSQDEKFQFKGFPKIISSSDHLFTELTPRTYSYRALINPLILRNIHVHARSSNNSQFSKIYPNKEDVKLTNSIETVSKIYGGPSIIQSRIIRKKDLQYKPLVMKHKITPALPEMWREKTLSSDRLLASENRPLSHILTTSNKTGGWTIERGNFFKRPPTSRKRGANNFRKDRVKTETALEMENASPNFGNLDEEIKSFTPKPLDPFLCEEDNVEPLAKARAKKARDKRKMLRIHNEAFDTSEEKSIESPYELKPKRTAENLEIDHLETDIQKNFHIAPLTERGQGKPKSELLISLSSIQKPGRKLAQKQDIDEKPASARPPSRHKSPGHKKTDSQIQEELFPKNPNPELDSSASVMISTQYENGTELMEFLEKGEWPKPKEIDINIPKKSPNKKLTNPSLPKTKSQPNKVGQFLGKPTWEVDFKKNKVNIPVNRLKPNRSGTLDHTNNRQILHLKTLEDFDGDTNGNKHSSAKNKSSKALRQMWNITKPLTSKQKENFNSLMKEEPDSTNLFHNKTDLGVKSDLPFNTSLDKQFVKLFAK